MVLRATQDFNARNMLRIRPILLIPTIRFGLERVGIDNVPANSGM